MCWLPLEQIPYTHNPAHITHRRYKVYDLATYSLLHALPSAGVTDVKMSGRLLLAVRAPGPQGLPLEAHSAENGQVNRCTCKHFVCACHVVLCCL